MEEKNMNGRKARGWDKKSGRWVKGTYFEYPDVTSSGDRSYIPMIVRAIGDVTVDAENIEKVEVDEKSIGRNTGECIGDEEIFEGDLLCFRSSLLLDFGVVRYGKHKMSSESYVEFFVQWLNQDNKEIYAINLSLLLKRCNHSDWSVIGNTYQNQEIPMNGRVAKDRGWDPRTEQWVYGAYFEYPASTFSLFNEEDFISTILCEDAAPGKILEDMSVEVPKESVGRGTGEQIDGKQLFEGDIIKVQRLDSPCEPAMIGVIRYGEYEDIGEFRVGFFIDWIMKFGYSSGNSLGSWLEMDRCGCPSPMFGKVGKITVVDTVYEKKLRGQ